ncbi:hypothetical protein J2Y03_002326 [Neobacillus niacini]|nr:hypothetical protein [Neobacillus niacini]
MKAGAVGITVAKVGEAEVMAVLVVAKYNNIVSWYIQKGRGASLIIC